MTCRNCGNEIADHLKFCSKCGTPVPSPPYTPPVYQQPAWQLNAPVAPVKQKSGLGKVLLIVGIVIVLLLSGIGVAVYFGVRSYLQRTKSSEAYALAESTLRESELAKERLGEIKSIGVPIGTHSEEVDGTGYAAFFMAVQGEKASGQYVVVMNRWSSKWRVTNAVVKLEDGDEIKIVDAMKVPPMYDPRNSNRTENENQNTVTPNSNNSNQKSKTVSGGVLNGKAISLPKPVYPSAAKSARASGAVVVQVTVDETGSVIAASAVSGHPLLQASAVASARQARFSPTLLSGKPVKVTGTLNYNFVLEP